MNNDSNVMNVISVLLHSLSNRRLAVVLGIIFMQFPQKLCLPLFAHRERLYTVYAFANLERSHLSDRATNLVSLKTSSIRFHTLIPTSP